MSDGPGLRAMLRTFSAALWGVIAYLLTTQTGVDDQGVVLISTLWIATWGLAEALYDAEVKKA